MDINFVLPVYVFLTLKVTVALTHMNHQAPRFHHQNPLYCSTKEKESSTSRMALGWVNLHFCVNYPFSQCVCVRHNSFIGLKAAGFLLFDWQCGPRRDSGYNYTSSRRVITHNVARWVRCDLWPFYCSDVH